MSCQDPNETHGKAGRFYVTRSFDNNWGTMVPIIVAPDGRELFRYDPYSEGIADADCDAMNGRKESR